MGRVVVADSSVLIALAEVGRIALIETLFQAIDIPPAVERETVEARPASPGASAVRQAMDEGWITVRTPDAKRLNRVRRDAPNLSQGELEALALCVGERSALLLVDERSARRVAFALGIPHAGTLGLILRALRQAHLSRDQAHTAIDDVVRAGLWVAPELVAELHRAVDRRR